LSFTDLHSNADYNKYEEEYDSDDHNDVNG